MFLGHEVHYYMVYIAYYTELNCKNYICKNDAFVAKIANMHLTETFVAIFAFAERLPTSATLELDKFLELQPFQSSGVEKDVEA